MFVIKPPEDYNKNFDVSCESSYLRFSPLLKGEIFPQSMEIIFICSGVTTIWAIGPGKPYGPPTPMGQMGAPRLRL